MDNLNGVRVWLSGSVPNDGDADSEKRVLDFVAAFAAAVFRAGGQVVHGSHPSLVPRLLDAAANYRRDAGRAAGLTLAVSRLFSADPAKYQIDLAKWQAQARVVEVP